jgi:hypothetical protein
MRRISHGLPLYLILSKVIIYQFLEEVQATKIRSSNTRSHLPISSSDLSSRFLSSQIPIKVLAQNFLKRNLSRGYQGQNPFSKKNLILLWAIP